jgi:hypothetical protein
MSFGQRFGWNDAGETPNIQLCDSDSGEGALARRSPGSAPPLI